MRITIWYACYIKYYILHIKPGIVLSNINPTIPPTNIEVLHRTKSTWSNSVFPGKLKVTITIIVHIVNYLML